MGNEMGYRKIALKISGQMWRVPTKMALPKNAVKFFLFFSDNSTA
jgi:hypothetical protein